MASLVVLAAGGGIQGVSAQTCSPGGFDAEARVSVGVEPAAVAVLDANGDGRRDLAAANAGAGTVSLLLGTGSGTFQAPVTYAAGTAPMGVAVGDFNGDGRPDLAVANAGSNDVSVLLNDGSGGFAAGVRHAVGTRPRAVVAADFNRDGRLDLATANETSNDVAVLIGTGTGSFGMAARTDLGSVPFGPRNPTSLAAGDLNGDGAPDLVTGNSNPRDFAMSVLLGTGTGGFGAPTAFGAGGGAESALALADLNADSRLDVVVVHNEPFETAASVQVYLGPGTGEFGIGATFPLGPTYGRAVATGDVDGDGRLDVVAATAAATSGAGTLGVLVGDGSGSFGTATHVAVGAGARGAALGDLNGDARTDLVSANAGSNDVSVVLDTTRTACGLSVGDGIVNEGQTGLAGMTFVVTLYPASTVAVQASYTTVDLTALAGSDYLPVAGVLTFPPGTTSRTVTVPVVGDRRAEDEEYLHLQLTSATNASVTRAAGLGTIRTDDAPALSIGDVVVSESSGNAFFTVTMTPATNLTVTVSYAAADGSARAGADYAATSGTLTFAPGVTAQAFAVPIVGDAAPEGEESFAVSLSGETNLGVARRTAVGTIADDDAVPTTYTFTDLGTLPGGTTSAAYGLDAAGVVVGSSNSGSSPLDRAVVWRLGSITDLGTLAGGTTSVAHAVTPDGRIAGRSTGSGSFEHAVLWEGSLLRDFGALHGNVASRAFGAAGEQAVGDVQTASGLRAMRWQAGTSPTDLGALPGGVTSSARDINARGQAAGWSGTTGAPTGPTRAFLWEPGSLTDLGTLGGSDSVANGVSDTGIVVGRAQPSGSTQFRGFRWQAGTMSDLGVLSGAPSSEAWDVNSGGDAVGESGGRAVLWPSAGGVADLNGVLPAGSGWTLTVARAINDRGQIAGSGALGGQGRAFLLTPPPLLVSVGDASVAEGTGGTREMAFTVSLSSAASRAVTVAYATSDVTASAGSDYSATQGTVTFPPGASTATVRVTVKGDLVAEGDEAFVVNLSAASLATILDGQGVGLIVDAGAQAKVDSFTATPALVSAGAQSTLRWSVGGASSVSITGVGANLPASGSATVGVLQTTAYTLTATGAAGNASATATVTVPPAPGQPLAAPTLTAPANGQSIGVPAVTVTWNGVPGATGYGIRVLHAGTGATIFSGSLSGQGSTSSVLSLPTGSYSALVRACTGADGDSTCGSFSRVDFSVTLGAPLDAPTVKTPLTGSTLTRSTTTLSWTPVVGATSYAVVLKELATGHTALQITVFSPATSTIFSLGTGDYELTVRACQAACGPASAPAGFQVLLPAVPSVAPTITSATVSGTDLTVNWWALTGADLYQIQVVQPGAGPGGGALSVAARQVSSTSATFPVPAGTMSIVVAGCNGTGCGPLSAPFSVSPAQTPVTPNLGTPMAGTVVAGPSVLFSWNRVATDNGQGNTVYRLFVNDLSRQTAALDVYTTQNFWAAYFKAEGARYDALVVANPGTAQQVVGPAAGFNVAGTSAVAPTLTTPAHQSTVRAGNLMLAWTPVAGATLYQYYISGGGQNPAVTGVTTGLFAQVPLTAVNGQPTSYVGIVRACPALASCAAGADAGWGPWSDQAGPGVTSFTVAP